MAANFAIVNLRGGEQRNIEPFLLENDAFPVMENMFLFRGRIKKRSGYIFVGTNGRVQSNIGTTNAVTGNLSVTLEEGTYGLTIATGVASFLVTDSVLTEIFTDPGGASPVTLLATGTGSATLNRATGALAITGSIVSATVSYFPGLPIMGLSTKETNPQLINDELSVAFDTRLSYQFSSVNDVYEDVTFHVGANRFTWQGSNSQFFWTSNFARCMWTTNNNPGTQATPATSTQTLGDGIRWYDSATGAQGWINFYPPITSTEFLKGCLIILPYKGRLVVLNTVEGTTASGNAANRFPQRARWSQVGTPFYVTPVPSNYQGGVQIDAWRSDIAGRGGFIDAPTGESIISAEFIKDTLIVYFERSTWQLVYTGIDSFPFFWQQINTELGVESTFSVVAFDRGVFGVGNYGIISTDSVNVARIDEKIPQEVFRIQNINQGPQRVHGIRDYTSELVYWTFPTLADLDGDSVSYDVTFPNQVLVYSYLDGTWAQFDDNFTAFGYFQASDDLTWEDLPTPWENVARRWDSGLNQGRYPDVIAGNQRGFVEVYSQRQNTSINDPSLIINDYTAPTVTCPSHNLTNNQYVKITDMVGDTTPNDTIFRVASATVDTFNLIDSNDEPVVSGGTYSGGGLITHLPIPLVKTKNFNPVFSEGISLKMNYIDVYSERTDEGEFTLEFFANDNISNPIETRVVNTQPEPLPTYTLPDPNYQLSQEKIWHRVYSNTYGAFVQNAITLSPDQIFDEGIYTSSLVIHGFIYYVTAQGRLPYDI